MALLSLIRESLHFEGAKRIELTDVRQAVAVYDRAVTSNL